MSASDLTFLELKTELERRGFDYLNSTELGYFVNRAYFDICDADSWPFTEATTTGAAPKTISDLNKVEYVLDSTNLVKLSPLDRRILTDYTTDLTTTGTPTWYYLTSGTTVNVYPANTSISLSVRYWKVPTILSADGDTPLVPNRFRMTIVTGAIVWAYRDNDESEMARAAQEDFQGEIEQMRDALLNQASEDRPDYISTYNSGYDSGGY